MYGKLVMAAFSILLVGGVIVCSNGRDIEKWANSPSNSSDSPTVNPEAPSVPGDSSFEKKIHEEVMIDAMKAYLLTLKGGNAMDAYIAAGQLKYACLQANNEARYKWALEQEQMCKKLAGLDR